MKRTATIALALFLLARHAPADEWEDALRGGLIGAALGAIVGHNSDLRDEWAIPTFAAAGALIGYGSGGGWWDGDGYEGNHYHGNNYYHGNYWGNNGWYDSWGRYNYGPRYSRYDDRYGPRYYGDRRYTKRQKTHKPTPAEMATRRDLTPGVELVHVPLTLPSGTIYNLQLIKLPDHFVGPQGEQYSELPTSEVLAERYLPKP